MIRFDAVFVGAATLDAIALVDRFPEPDERVLAADVVHAGGGPAATAAVAAARLGLSVALIATVGDDDAGQAIVDGLAGEGVDVRGVSRSPTQDSATSVIVVDRTRGTRAICTRPSTRIDLLPAAAALLEATPVVHVDQLGWSVVDAHGPLAPRQLLSVDAGNPIPGFSPRGVGLYAPTVEALRRSHPEATVAELLAHAVSDGCRTVVATDGASGSHALTEHGESAFAPAHPVDVVSTLGAGDVFHGALVAAVVRGLPLDQQLVFANAAAALSCRGLDGRSRIPTPAEVLPVTTP